MPSFETMLTRLLLALVIGACIGGQREYVSKDAGLRTLILISLGSCLFTIFSILIGEATSPDRVASNIVTGIGFLGAGVIFKGENGVKGLTTAASVWATAALGMGAGGGYYLISIVGTAIVLFALLMLTYTEELIEKLNQTRNYRIVCDYEEDHLHKFEDLFEKCGLRFRREKQSRKGRDLVGNWSVSGSEKKHNHFISEILHDKSIREFDF